MLLAAHLVVQLPLSVLHPPTPDTKTDVSLIQTPIQGHDTGYMKMLMIVLNIECTILSVKFKLLKKSLNYVRIPRETGLLVVMLFVVFAYVSPTARV